MSHVCSAAVVSLKRTLKEYMPSASCVHIELLENISVHSKLSTKSKYKTVPNVIEVFQVTAE
jgi:hypothetical protein